MPGTPPERKIRVRVSADRMTAEVEVQAEVGEGAGAQAVRDALRAAGVVFGIDDGAVASAAERPGEPVVVARGTPPVPGEDGRLQWIVDPERALRAAERDDGSVDFHELGFVQAVRKGDSIARRVRAEPGRDGTGVDGQPAAARAGHEVDLPRGERTDAAGDELRAAADGHLTTRRGLACVEPLVRIDGDVDLGTGNVRFAEGAVHVAGSIQDGFEVRAGGDVVVAGEVFAAVVEAGGHARARGGILGGRVRAGGDVVARFVENATVVAAGDVTVHDGIVASEVAADGRVVVSARGGRIAGGRVRAGREVVAAVVGAPMGTETVVEVGAPAALRARQAAILADLGSLRPAVERASQAVQVLCERRASGRATRADLDMLARSEEKLGVLGPRERELEEELRAVESALDAARRGKVEARERLLAGTVLRFGTVVQRADAEWPGGTWALGEGGRVELVAPGSRGRR